MGPIEFARWLAEQRARLKQEGRIATQGEIAKRAGVSRSMVAMIEGMAKPGTQNVFQPSRAVVAALARAVGASVNEALVTAGYAPEGSTSPEDWPLDIREILKELQELPREDRELVRSFVGRLSRRVMNGAELLPSMA